MAFRRFRRARGVTRAPRRNRIWVPTNIQVTGFGDGNAASVVINLTDSFESVTGSNALDETVLAMRGSLLVTPVLNVDTSGTMAFGAAYVSDDAIAAGAVPDLLTDAYDWLYIDARGVSNETAGGDYTPIHTSDPASLAGHGHRSGWGWYNRSMRKHRENSSSLVLLGQYEAQDGPTATFQINGFVRVLYALP